MIGGRRSLHELALASAARMVVAPDLDILRASDEASVGAEASSDGERASAAAELEPCGVERAPASDPVVDASARRRSGRESLGILHAVIPARRATKPQLEDRLTSAD